uniref:Uncharacterized protein n=1 Tax=Plectus sambesii TaxID=2011161 RepID=A0A914VLE3_9BILA
MIANSSFYLMLIFILIICCAELSFADPAGPRPVRCTERTCQSVGERCIEKPKPNCHKPPCDPIMMCIALPGVHFDYA